eukprot:343944-Pelagomonas_calceolata.AAC.2
MDIVATEALPRRLAGMVEAGWKESQVPNPSSFNSLIVHAKSGLCAHSPPTACTYAPIPLAQRGSGDCMVITCSNALEM